MSPTFGDSAESIRAFADIMAAEDVQEAGTSAPTRGYTFRESVGNLLTSVCQTTEEANLVPGLVDAATDDIALNALFADPRGALDRALAERAAPR